MKKQDEKTNALRLLDAQGIPHAVHLYDAEATDGQAVAALDVLPEGEGRQALVELAGRVATRKS